MERFPVLLAGPLGSCLSPQGAPELRVWGAAGPAPRLLSPQCLDASRPWLCYWILHSLELLEEPIPDAVASE